MKAETAVRQVQSRKFKSAPVPEESNTVSQAEVPDAPKLTATRAGQLIPGQYYAPVIRLKPRHRDTVPAMPPVADSPAAEVVDIETAEVRRRVQGISRSIAQASLEVLAGTRPITQLSRWLDPVSYEKLQLRMKLLRGQRERRRTAAASKATQLHRNPQVRSARLCRINSNTYEASLTVIEHNRVRAVALRLEYRRELWKVTALEIG